MKTAASEKRPAGTLAERFWSIARAARPAEVLAGEPDAVARAVIRHVLGILDALARGEVGEGLSQSTLSFLQLLRQSEAAGDLSYSSPESARGDTVDERSLVFSVGVLVFEELTGRHPFGAVPGARRVARMQKCELGSGVQFFPQVPPQLRTVLMKAMGPFPEERYQSLRELRSHLERYVAGRGDETPPRPKRVMLRGLPPSPADLLFAAPPDEDQVPTTVHAKIPPAVARRSGAEIGARNREPAKGGERAAAPKRARAILERLGWVAVGACSALAVTLIALPRLKSAKAVVASPVAAAERGGSAATSATSPTSATITTSTPTARNATSPMEPPAVPPVAPAPARFDAELAARNALAAVRPCFAGLDHTVSFGAGLLFNASGALSRKAYLSPDEPLSPDERRCVARALVGVSAGAAPAATAVPELRLRLRPDGARDDVRVK